ncbi:hypothetical protein BKA62DRAFT_204791 [Auriculariales sp. MPI-PUGE-AT-0066]|nr:hypothetical protein BKA62DRAFT_204791 [Auriculariales sp. MPI-PUGE-AT-0066]
MHRQTAWSRTGPSGNLPSDRLAPTPSRNSPRTSPKPTTSPLPAGPRSKEVKRLEALVTGLSNANAYTKTDPKGGCFCLARSHNLSPYTPLCLACGLIICSVNRPFFVCPSCRVPLVAPNQRPMLFARVQSELEVRIRAEEIAEQRARDEVRRQAGAFPTLSGHASPLQVPTPETSRAPTPTQQHQTHKVISLGAARGKGRGGKVTISSYTPVPAGTSKQQQAQPASKGEEDPLEDSSLPPRVPPPPNEPPHARKVDGRRWEDRRPGAVGAVYVPPKPKPRDEPMRVGEAIVRGRGLDGRHVPGAAPAEGTKRRKRAKKEGTRQAAADAAPNVSQEAATS